VCGLRALVVTAGTTDVARRWSWHLASAQALSHNPAIVTDLEHAGSADWRDIAENVGMAPSNDPQMLFTAYMNSPGHRANILDPKVRYLGVGVVERAGYAWNTLDFVDAYTSSYGRTRVPAAGITMDSKPILVTTDVASMEQPDQRFGTARSGGVGASRMYFTGPSAGNDSGYAYLRTLSAAAGHGDVVMRDALALGFARSLSVQLATHDRRGRAVAVQVLLGHAYGGAVSLGTVRVGATPRWFTFTLPASARAFRDSVVFRVGASGVSAAGGSVRLNVYDVSVGA
jgi:hypothetical protein